MARFANIVESLGGTPLVGLPNLSPTPDGEHIGLYLQLGRQTELAGVFMDPAIAQMVMDFLDASLGATAAANAELLRRLESEQPMFWGKPVERQQDFIEPDADELLLGDDG